MAIFTCHSVSGQKKDSLFSTILKKSSAGLHLSSFGPGLGMHSVSPANPRLQFDLQFTFFQLRKAREFTLRGDSKVDIAPDLRHLMVSGFASYYPWINKGFYGKAGLGYNFGQRYKARITSETGLELGGIEISGEDFGTVDVGVKYNKLIPYLGAGYLKKLRSSRFSLGFDLGCFYLGSPTLEADFEGFLESTTLDRELLTIQNNMKNYSFYPYLSVQLHYNLFH